MRWPGACLTPRPGVYRLVSSRVDLMAKRRPPTQQIPTAVSRALEQALFALGAQRHDEAERLARRVLASSPDNVVAAQVLGHTLLQQGRAAEAVDPLQTAARISNDPAIETLLARALAAAGRRDEAIEQLRQTAARRPPFTLAFLELGDQLAAAGRFDEGIAAFDRGLALTPDAAVLRMGLGHLHLKRNDRAKARHLFLQVRAAEPRRHDALVALAKVAALDGEYAGAVALYERALELRPGDPVTRIEHGKCLLELGEREAGEASLRAAIRSGGQEVGLAINALATASHGRFFLRPSAAKQFLGVEAT
jgi:tetratricopeptide (TPR) repeat protein